LKNNRECFEREKASKQISIQGQECQNTIADALYLKPERGQRVSSFGPSTSRLAEGRPRITFTIRIPLDGSNTGREAITDEHL
jgi:hypothetical protein